MLMVLYPWSIRWLLRATGILDRPSRILDPIPAVADHVIPVLGWLAIPAAVLVWKNLRVIDRAWARRLLWLFLATHAGTVIYTVTRFMG